MRVHRSRAPADVRRPKDRRGHHTHVAVAVIAAAFAAAALRAQLIQVPDTQDARRNARSLVTRINPNTATPAELAVLPGIGDTKASRIVTFREAYSDDASSRPAFQRPEDLQGIRGIGPKTIEKLRPYLRFDE